MKKLLHTLILLLVFVHIAYGQADLQLVGESLLVSPSSQHVGLPINISMNIQNFGNSISGLSKAKIYISPTIYEFVGREIGEISLESIDPDKKSDVIQFSRPIPYGLTDGNYYVIVKIYVDGALQTFNDNNVSLMQIEIKQDAWAAQNIPYPIIFIHGIKADNSLWDTLIESLKNIYGWSCGGNMNFCLNYDDNLNTSDQRTDYKDFYKEGDLQPDDYYTINFDVDKDGSLLNDNNLRSSIIKSNESAIVKQGLAIQDAIKHVLAVTHKDKVILVGHSMGGLAAREYLQDKRKWQSDQKHHVAKLSTIGTPHGGSNATDFGISFGLILADPSSEAIRDLRTSYTYSYYFPFPALNSDSPGTYLFGGVEDLSYMTDQMGMKFNVPYRIPFYNADVNCDGNVSGQGISGLNKKPYQTDLAYACIIGTGDPKGGGGGVLEESQNGDGVVTETSANINNFLPVNAETFTIPTSGVAWNSAWHSELPNQVSAIMRVIDEPGYFRNAYDVSLGQIYNGTISLQGDNGIARDDDDYKINIPSNGNLNIEMSNIPTPVFTIRVYNSSYTSVYSINSNGKSYINTHTTLPAGNYYIVLSGIPTTDSWKYPYAFKLTYSPVEESYCNITTTLTSPTGTFDDGSGSSDYNNNSDCKWKIQPSGATSITLNFSEFDVNSSADTLYVYDGESTESLLLVKLTGNELPGSITSTGGVMFVRFSTDAYVTSSGWKASYTSVTVPTYCNGTTILTKPTGTFSDGSESNNYGNNTHCSWLINPPGAYSITLNLQNFATEPDNDVVSVYDGRDNSGNLLGSFSGISIPEYITSSSGSMFIEFVTNSTVAASGWSASYSSYVPTAINGIVAYEYWFDDDYKTSFLQTIIPQKTNYLDQNIPTNDLTSGLHTYHIRYKNDTGKWSSIVSDFFQKVPVSANGSRKINSYEYWFDTDYSSKVLTSIAPGQTISVNGGFNVDPLSYGLHTYHVRYKDDAGQWSSVVTEFFTKIKIAPEGSRKIIAHEYWFDEDYGSKVSAAVSGQTISINSGFDVTALSTGLHIYHSRFKDDAGQWSSVVSEFFNKVPNAAAGSRNIVASEYWFDDGYATKITTPITPGQTISVNGGFEVGSLSKGLHTYHVRYKDDAGQWSSVASEFFTKMPVAPSGSHQIITHEYWFDEDYGSKVSASVSGQTISINSGFDVTAFATGLHIYHTRIKDDAGQWSSVVSEFFNKVPNAAAGSRNIVASEYWFDDGYASKITTPITPGQSISVNGGLDVASLSVGLHTYHVRYKDDAGQWSSVVSEFIHKSLTDSSPRKITTYRYWFDSDKANMITVDLPAPVNPYQVIQNIYTCTLTLGSHSIHFQFRDSNHSWSSVFTDAITKSAATVPVITPSGSTTFCAGTPFTLTCNEAGSYLWSNGATTQSIPVTESGSYNVTINQESGCGLTSNNTVVHVNTTPLPPAIGSITQSTCIVATGSIGLGGLPDSWTLTSSPGNAVLSGTGSTTTANLTTGTYTFTATNTNGCTSAASDIAVINPQPPPSVNKQLIVHVFLEGAFNAVTGLMHTTLLDNLLLPKSQPYNVAPLNYNGTEHVTNIPADVVDWVLVELRQAASAAEALPGTVLPGWPRACFLKSDGSVVDLDGTTIPTIGNPSIAGNLYVIIRHRNHIAIISALGMTANCDDYTYNFTDAMSKAHGNSAGFRQIIPGTFGMVSGDSDGDSSVSVLDFSQWATDFGKTLIYSQLDIDMDGEVSVLDFSKWATNFGMENIAPLKDLNLQGIEGGSPLRYRSQVPGN